MSYELMFRFWNLVPTLRDAKVFLNTDWRNVYNLKNFNYFSNCKNLCCEKIALSFLLAMTFLVYFYNLPTPNFPLLLPTPAAAASREAAAAKTATKSTASARETASRWAAKSAAAA